MLRSAAIFAPAALLFAIPAAAQSVIQLPLFDGAVILRAEGGLLEDRIEPDGALVTFWRPVLFGTAERPIGGRMDCRLGGVRSDYSDELFDVQARYEENRLRRLNSGLNDNEEVDYAEDGTVRRLQITGRAFRPLRHYVLTYLAMRDGNRLYDIRLNCEFQSLQSAGDVDYAALMHQFVDLAVPVAAPPASSSNAPENEGQ